MSDYLFMLESHLNATQNRAVAQVIAAAQEAGLNAFLAGGAIRDMLGGFAVRDLDFVVEGSPTKILRLLEKQNVTIGAKDDLRKHVDLRFPGGVAAGIGMARKERYPKAGSRPQVTPATIYEHLRSRDFTINAVALSLNPGSRGLLIDPTNGAGDLAARELRAISNYAFYDEPARMLRMLRFKVRLGLSIESKTQAQFDSAIEAGLHKKIPAESLRLELIALAAEPNPGEAVRALEAAGLLTLFGSMLSGARINHAGFQKLQKALQAVPYGVDLDVEPLGLFLLTLTDGLPPKERSALVKSSGLTKADVNAWQKLEPKARKLEKQLASATLKKASQVYRLLASAPGDEVLYLAARSQQRIVQDRLKNYLQKYLPAALEVTDAEVIEKSGAERGTPKFRKAREEMVAARLDSRVRKPVLEMAEAAAPMPARRFN